MVCPHPGRAAIDGRFNPQNAVTVFPVFPLRSVLSQNMAFPPLFPFLFFRSRCRRQPVGELPLPFRAVLLTTFQEDMMPHDRAFNLFPALRWEGRISSIFPPVSSGCPPLCCVLTHAAALTAKSYFVLSTRSRPYPCEYLSCP